MKEGRAKREELRVRRGGGKGGLRGRSQEPGSGKVTTERIRVKQASKRKDTGQKLLENVASVE